MFTIGICLLIIGILWSAATFLFALVNFKNMISGSEFSSSGFKKHLVAMGSMTVGFTIGTIGLIIIIVCFVQTTISS